MTQLAPRNWQDVEKLFNVSNPFSLAVLDDFFQPVALNSLRTALLESNGWEARDIAHENNGKSWVVRQLFNNRPKLMAISPMISELRNFLPQLFTGRGLVNHWAISCSRNDGIFPHCDGGNLALNIWLTPDVFNEDSSIGGLILFDVKRNAAMSHREYASESGGCTRFVNEHSRGKQTSIPYRYNRAVLFDSWCFHASDLIRFGEGSLRTARLNLTLSFD